MNKFYKRSFPHMQTVQSTGTYFHYSFTVILLKFLTYGSLLDYL